ncbi:MAG: non-canonical purine NTP pyrophosphatase [Spirochaetes bacterium]|nr:non-canonical purine NTP pyrophosphatase [Spirochaetota bacterium]HOV45838.1 non-canonical purine NTP pyrophosphatase [Exilispira sp.]
MNTILFMTNNKHKSYEIENFFNNTIKILQPSDFNIQEDIEENGKNFKENAFLKVNHISSKYKSDLLSNIPILADDSGLVVLKLCRIIKILKKLGLDGKSASQLFSAFLKDKNLFDDKTIKQISEFWEFYFARLEIYPGVMSKRFANISPEKLRNTYLIELLLYIGSKNFYKKVKRVILQKKIEISKLTQKNKIKLVFYNLFYIFYLTNLKVLLLTSWKACFQTVLCFKINEKYFYFNGKVSGYITKFPAGNNGFGYDPIFYYPGLHKTFAQLDIKEKNEISHRARALKKLSIFLSKKGMDLGKR